MDKKWLEAAASCKRQVERPAVQPNGTRTWACVISLDDWAAAVGHRIVLRRPRHGGGAPCAYSCRYCLPCEGQQFPVARKVTTWRPCRHAKGRISFAQPRWNAGRRCEGQGRLVDIGRTAGSPGKSASIVHIRAPALPPAVAAVSKSLSAGTEAPASLPS